jgi:hypothetical protein
MAGVTGNFSLLIFKTLKALGHRSMRIKSDQAKSQFTGMKGIQGMNPNEPETTDFLV